MQNKLLDFDLLISVLLTAFVTTACVSQKKLPSEIKKEKDKAAPPPTPTARPEIAKKPPLAAGMGTFIKVPWSEIGDTLDDGDFLTILPALESSLQWYEQQDPLENSSMPFAQEKISTRLLKETLLEAKKIFSSVKSIQEAMPELKKNFTLWKASPPAGKNLLVTGYYIPVIQGSTRKSAKFNIPVYGVPHDLVSVNLGEFFPDMKGKILRGRKKGNQLVPYFNRAEIRANDALETRAEVLAWASAEWDTFVMEVQGSGVLQLEDGREFLLSYAEQNGRSYQPVGKLLLQEKIIPKEKMSMQAIGKYVAENPTETRRVFDFNPSFVFFNKEEGNAKGALGFALTPERSVAVDFSVFPRGAMAFIKTHKPSINSNGQVGSEGGLHRFVFNQDTGGAIRGLGRMDFFWGKDEKAPEKAGAMQHEGDYFLILKNNP